MARECTLHKSLCLINYAFKHSSQYALRQVCDVIVVLTSKKVKKKILLFDQLRALFLFLSFTEGCFLITENSNQSSCFKISCPFITTGGDLRSTFPSCSLLLHHTWFSRRQCRCPIKDILPRIPNDNLSSMHMEHA